jgi:hypothetical protein
MKRANELTDEEEQLLLLLKVGRKNIKTTKLLLKEMQFENTNRDRRYLRELIRTLRIKHKVPILSMRNSNAKGYFIAETANEILEFIAPISSQIKEEKRMLRALVTNDLEEWKELLKGV